LGLVFSYHSCATGVIRIVCENGANVKVYPLTMRKITFSTLLQILTRNILVLVPLAIAGVFAGNFISASTTPMFRSSADLFISTPASAVDIGLLATGSTFSQERVKSYTQIINAPATLQPVIDRLELNTTPEALALRITATAPPDTVVIRVLVVDQNPVRAAAIANEVALQFALTAESIELPQINSTSPVKVSMARPAVPEFGPISPKKNTNRLLGAFGFFVLGYLFFLVRYVIDLTIKNLDDLQGLPLLAAIGFDPAADMTPLISDLGPYAARTEAFRSLRTNVISSLELVKGSVVAITSGLSEEGKTTTSINLAQSTSSQGLKTLLIEADLRRPRLEQYLPSLRSAGVLLGLSDMLDSRSESALRKFLPKAIQQISSELSILHAGAIPLNPTELLAGPNLGALLKIVKAKFDIVIIDCPPVLPVTDASVICQCVDGAIVVVHGGKTKTAAFEATLSALNSVDAKILGVVINKIPNSRDSADYGYRSGYGHNYKRTYGYFSKRRGYVPYGPYDASRDMVQARKKLKTPDVQSKFVGFFRFLNSVNLRTMFRKTTRKIDHPRKSFELTDLSREFDILDEFGFSNLPKAQNPPLMKKPRKR
jgi:succinoglycan biosynthesis transport protein ExoP